MANPLDLLLSILTDGAVFCFSGVGIAGIIGWGRLADLTPDAAFTSGGVGLWYSTSYGISAAAGPFFGFLFGAMLGAFTAAITVGGVPPLLASLIVIGFAYTLNWQLLGRPLRTLADEQTILSGSSGQMEV